MRIEGKIHTVSHRGEIITRFPQYVPPGTEVIDKRRNVIGKISWVFGPVGSPYVEVKPRKDSRRPLTMVGRSVFVEDENYE